MFFGIFRVYFIRLNSRFNRVYSVSSTAFKSYTDNIRIEDPGFSLSAIFQLGSVFAIFWYFRNDMLNLKRQFKNYFDSFYVKS